MGNQIRTPEITGDDGQSFFEEKTRFHGTQEKNVVVKQYKPFGKFGQGGDADRRPKSGKAASPAEMPDGESLKREDRNVRNSLVRKETEQKTKFCSGRGAEMADDMNFRPKYHARRKY